MAWISKLALLPLLASAGQDTVPTIRTETRAVQIDVAVRDSHGAPVHGLTKDGFTILDDGKPRAIAFFNAEAGEPAPDAVPSVMSSPPPSVTTPAVSPSRVLSNTAPANVPPEALTVILLDASSPTLDAPLALAAGGKLNNGGVGIGYLAQARQGAIDVMATLQAKERIAIYHISPGGLKVVQDFTADRDLLRESIKAWSIPNDWKPMCGPTVLGLAQPIAPPRAQAPDPSSGPKDLGCGVVTENAIRTGAMSTIDSLRVLGEKLALLPGRKNLIWVTPGFPMRFLRDMEDQSQKAIAQLNDANVALNAIDVRGVGPGLRDPQVAVMQSVTEATGGKAYLQNDIGGAMVKADEATHTDYTLGFYLADNERDGTFHKLELRTDRAGLSLSYRKGYVAEKVSGSSRPKRSDTKPTEAAETELLNPVDATAIGISGAADVTPGEPHATLHLKLSLDPRGLTLRPQNNGPGFKVTRMFAEMDARGTVLVEGQDTKEIVVPTTSLDASNIEMIRWEQAMPLMPGAATVRVIVRDEATGHAGTLTVPIPDVRK